MSVLEMKVPSPGESISEVEIASWLVSDGDYVEKDQAIAEVDSDKATLELPAEQSGIITLKAEEGDVVKVGQVVCLIDTSAARPEGSVAPVAKEEAKSTKETQELKEKAIDLFFKSGELQLDYLEISDMHSLLPIEKIEQSSEQPPGILL